MPWENLSLNCLERLNLGRCPPVWPPENLSFGILRGAPGLRLVSSPRTSPASPLQKSRGTFRNRRPLRDTYSNPRPPAKHNSDHLDFLSTIRVPRLSCRLSFRGPSLRPLIPFAPYESATRQRLPPAGTRRSAPFTFRGTPPGACSRTRGKRVSSKCVGNSHA